MNDDQFNLECWSSSRTDSTVESVKIPTLLVQANI